MDVDDPRQLEALARLAMSQIDHADPADLTAVRTVLDRLRASSPKVPAGTEVRLSRHLVLAVRSD